MTEDEQADEIQWADGFAPTLGDFVGGESVYRRCGCQVRVLSMTSDGDSSAVVHTEAACEWHGGNVAQPKVMPWDTKVSPERPRFPRLG